MSDSESPNNSSVEDETKSPSILICSEKKNQIFYQIFYMLWQYNLDKYFDLTFEENRSLLSSMTAKICFKMLMKSSVDHLISVFKKLQRGLDLKNFKFATAHFSMDAICRTDSLYVTHSQADFCSALVSINPLGDTLYLMHMQGNTVF